MIGRLLSSIAIGADGEGAWLARGMEERFLHYAGRLVRGRTREKASACSGGMTVSNNVGSRYWGDCLWLDGSTASAMS
jgi:hypothetical protein